MTTPLEISKMVRACRKQAGLTQQELAEIAGIGKTAVFDIEKGKLTVQLDTLLKVLKVLNIELILKSPLTIKEQTL